jgi:hypothetical protein
MRGSWFVKVILLLCRKTMCETHICINEMKLQANDNPGMIEAWAQFLKDHPDIALELAPDLL